MKTNAFVLVVSFVGEKLFVGAVVTIPCLFPFQMIKKYIIGLESCAHVMTHNYLNPQFWEI